MLAYHNDPAVKEKYLARVRAHRAADELVKGQYWNDGKGCAVGCCVHSGDHSAYERELGIPTVLARLEDVHFERLFNGDAMAWPEKFLDTIAVGANLKMVWPQYALWLLADGDYAVIRHAKKEQTRKAIEGVTALYRRWVETGDNPSVAKFRYAAAYAAAAYDAYAAADAAAAAAYAAAAYDATAAADAAAAAAAAAAAYVAYVAYVAYDADAARTKFWKASAAKFLELLAQSPVPQEVTA